jgi:hypothetical protein
MVHVQMEPSRACPPVQVQGRGTGRMQPWSQHPHHAPQHGTAPTCLWITIDPLRSRATRKGARPHGAASTRPPGRSRITHGCAAGPATVPQGARLELVGLRVKPKATTEKEFINEVQPPPAASSAPLHCEGCDPHPPVLHGCNQGVAALGNLGQLMQASDPISMTPMDTPCPQSLS